MTTGLTVSITDELVAELEALASECVHHFVNWYEPRYIAAFPECACDQDFVVAASPATILALLAERAELKRDSERYKYLSEASLIIGIGWDHDGHFSPDPKAELDAAVDKAMGPAE